MEEMDCYRISTKNGIDSVNMLKEESKNPFALNPPTKMQRGPLPSLSQLARSYVVPSAWGHHFSNALSSSSGEI